MPEIELDFFYQWFGSEKKPSHITGKKGDNKDC